MDALDDDFGVGDAGQWESQGAEIEEGAILSGVSANAQSVYASFEGLSDQDCLQIVCAVMQRRPKITPQLVQYAIPDLTFAPTKACTEKRFIGVIKSYNAQQGFGFVFCPELKEVFGYDCFIHKQQLGPYVADDKISFAVFLSKDGKPQAFDVAPIDGKLPPWETQDGNPGGPPGGTTVYGKEGKGKDGKGKSKGKDKGSALMDGSSGAMMKGQPKAKAGGKGKFWPLRVETAGR